MIDYGTQRLAHTVRDVSGCMLQHGCWLTCKRHNPILVIRGQPGQMGGLLHLATQLLVMSCGLLWLESCSPPFFTQSHWYAVRVQQRSSWLALKSSE